MSYDSVKLSAALNGIEQLKQTVVSEIENLQNVDQQLGSLAVIVNNFVMQTLQVVANNEDIPAVNEQLANSLIQIRDFVVNRHTELKNASQKLEQRLDAYQQCQLVLNEALKIEPADSSPDNDDAESTRHKNKENIKEKLDADGKYPKRRKPGTRPEKLRDIRNVEADIHAQKNSEEDI